MILWIHHLEILRFAILSKYNFAGKSRQFLMSNGKGSKKIQIVIFDVDGKYYCISNKCQHQEGPLSEGYWMRKRKL
jgi:nitrite reductase/ring-hydroxylating ferredoxin subunit